MTKPANPAWRPNTGHLPDYERVYVQLRNGMMPAEPWPVVTGRRETTRWSLEGHPFDIVEWRGA